jgi:hypothetical protein
MACLPGSTTSARGASFALGGDRCRRCRGRLGGRGSVHPPHHRRRLLPAQEGQGQGGAHKDNGDRGGELGQERRSPGGAEDRLAGAAEGGADAGALAVLQKHDADKGQGHDYMDDNDASNHKLIKI